MGVVPVSESEYLRMQRPLPVRELTKVATGQIADRVVARLVPREGPTIRDDEREVEPSMQISRLLVRAGVEVSLQDEICEPARVIEIALRNDETLEQLSLVVTALATHRRCSL